MIRALVVYATREGQARKVAEHVAATLRARGDEVRVVDAASPPADLDVGAYATCVLAASVHVGKHEREMIDFVKAHRAELERIPTAFLSISMAEAGVEDPAAPPEQHEKAAARVREVVDRFCAATGFRPDSVRPVAGALVYTRYDVITRFVMRMIARSTGASTDTSCDHEYTDWEALDRFVDALASEVERDASAA